LFSKARLSIRKPFNKIGNQGMVNSSKEGNAAIGSAPNSYHLVHHSSDKEFKNHKEKVNAPKLALCCRGFGIYSIDIKKQFPTGGVSVGGAISSSSTLTSSLFSIHNHTYT
jgi:hypothetical protein